MTAVDAPVGFAESPPKRRKVNHDGDLQKKREQNDGRLKSIFESIFEKYERDFNGIGDEIDLETGHIVVDNGHLLRMKHEVDAGIGIDDLAFKTNCTLSEEDETDGSSEEEIDDGEDQLVVPDLETRYVDDVLQNPIKIIDNPPEFNVPSFDDDEDELAIGRKSKKSAFQTDILHQQNATSRPTYKMTSDPRWQAPPLPPGSSDSRPVHRRLTLPALIQPKDTNIDLGEWRQRSSVWEIRPTKNEESPAKQSRAAQENSKPDSHGSDVDHSLTEEQRENLRYLKTHTTLTNSELIKYFPGHTELSLAALAKEIEGRVIPTYPDVENSQDLSAAGLLEVPLTSAARRALEIEESQLSIDNRSTRTFEGIDSDIWEVPDQDSSPFYSLPILTPTSRRIAQSLAAQKSTIEVQQGSPLSNRAREIQNSEVTSGSSPPPSSIPMGRFANCGSPGLPPGLMPSSSNYNLPRPHQAGSGSQQTSEKSTPSSRTIKPSYSSIKCRRRTKTSPAHRDTSTQPISSSPLRSESQRLFTSQSPLRAMPRQRQKARSSESGRKDQIPVIDLTTPDRELDPQHEILEQQTEPASESQRVASTSAMSMNKSLSAREIPDSQPSQSEQHLLKAILEPALNRPTRKAEGDNPNAINTSGARKGVPIRATGPKSNNGKTSTPSTPSLKNRQTEFKTAPGTSPARKACENRAASKSSTVKTASSLSLSHLYDSSDDDLSTPVSVTKVIKPQPRSSVKLPTAIRLPMNPDVLSDDELG